MDRAPPAQDSNGPAVMMEREGRARGGTAKGGTASGGKLLLGDNPSRQPGTVHRVRGYESRCVFLFCPYLRWFVENCCLATTHLDSLAPSIEDAGTNPAAFSCYALIYDGLWQPIPTPGIVAIGTAVANSSQCTAPQRCP